MGYSCLSLRRRSTPRNQTSFSDERRRKFIPTLQRALPPINHGAKSAIRPDQQVKQVPVY